LVKDAYGQQEFSNWRWLRISNGLTQPPEERRPTRR